MKSLIVPSFAKVNWVLKILGRRSDGYHEVRTFLQTIDLSDHLVFERTSAPSVRLTVEGRPVETGPGNLVSRAATLLQSSTGCRFGAWIHLNKRIPIGAGLGGGSSNAAVSLLALNALWACGLTAQELCVLASRLGSDVPFFIYGGLVLAEGRGEKIHPLPDPGPSRLSRMIILFPGLSVETASAYRLGCWGPLAAEALLTWQDPKTTIQRFCGPFGELEEPWTLFENDFEEPVLRGFPALADAAGCLREAGSRRVLLCGSGSAMAAFVPADEFEEVAQEVLQRNCGEVFLAQSLSRKSYREILTRAGVVLS